MGDLFGGGKQKIVNETKVDPMTQAIRSMLTRYMLMRLQRNQGKPQTFEQYRADGPQAEPSFFMTPPEAREIGPLESPGAPPGVSPELAAWFQRNQIGMG